MTVTAFLLLAILAITTTITTNNGVFVYVVTASPDDDDDYYNYYHHYNYQACVTIENTAPTNGVWFTNVWLGIHDGEFDMYDIDVAASTELERLAEDGNTEPLSTLFRSDDSDDDGNIVDATTSGGNIGPGTAVETCFDFEYDDFNTDLFLSFASQVIPSVRINIKTAMKRYWKWKWDFPSTNISHLSFLPVPSPSSSSSSSFRIVSCHSSLPIHSLTHSLIHSTYTSIHHFNSIQSSLSSTKYIIPLQRTMHLSVMKIRNNIVCMISLMTTWKMYRSVSPMC
jgi:hypothetical protein